MSNARILLAPDDPTPAFEQIRRQIIGHIASGALPVGSRLPPLRQLARDLGVAVGTAAHAYRELEAAGVIETRRGGGTRVTSVPAPVGPGHDPERLRVLAEEFVDAALAAEADPQAALDAVVTAIRHRRVALDD